MNYKPRAFLRFLALAVLLFCAAFPLFAADPTGSVNGSILDASGAAVPNAKVVVTAPKTGFSRVVTSAADGGFVAPLLPVGMYNVVVEVSGFKRVQRNDVEVRAEISTPVFARLEVGSVTETVTVSSHADQVDTRSGTLRDTIGERAIRDLPLN